MKTSLLLLIRPKPRLLLAGKQISFAASVLVQPHQHVADRKLVTAIEQKRRPPIPAAVIIIDNRCGGITKNYNPFLVALAVAFGVGLGVPVGAGVGVKVGEGVAPLTNG